MKKLVIGTALVGVVALVLVLSTSSLVTALAPVLSPSDPSGGAMKVYSTSENVTLAPGKTVLFYVSCTTSSCSPAKYHSAAVITTFVSEVFGANTSTLRQIYWFGAPTCGLSGMCANKVHTVPTYTNGPLTLQYDAYATEIDNSNTTTTFTVAVSFTAEYESGGT